MNAKEAKQQALSITDGRNKTGYEAAIKAITQAAKDGKMECQVYAILPAGAANELKAAGFILTSQMDRNESYTTISWKDA